MNVGTSAAPRQCTYDVIGKAWRLSMAGNKPETRPKKLGGQPTSTREPVVRMSDVGVVAALRERFMPAAPPAGWPLALFLCRDTPAA